MMLEHRRLWFKKKKNDSKILEGNWKAGSGGEKIVTDELSKDEDTKSNNMAMIDAIKNMQILMSWKL